MFDRDRFAALPHGEEKMIYLKKCISEADNEKSIKDMLWLRYYYIREAVFYDDQFKALVMFPELLKLYDDNPGIIKPDSFTYPYEWIIDSCSNYYQISIEQIETYLRRFRDFLTENNFPMKKYYLRESGALLYLDTERSAESLRKYEEADDDSGEDDVNGLSSVIHRSMQFGDIEKAMRVLNDLLERHDYGEFPEALFGDIAYEFAKRGRYSESEHYANIMLRLLDRDKWISNLMQISCIMIARTNTDMHSAYDMFCECAGMYSRIKEPICKFYFANAAYRLFTAMKKQGAGEIHARLSADFELFNSDGIYDTDELKEHFYRAADDLAKKFDKRNGNSMFSDELAFEFPEAPETIVEIPTYGCVKPAECAYGILYRSGDVPGYDRIAELLGELGWTDSVKYRIVSEEHNAAEFIIYDKSGKRYSYRMGTADAVDVNSLICTRYVDRAEMEKMSGYDSMLAVLSDNAHTDRYDDIRRTMTIADALNTGGAAVVLAISVLKSLPSAWLHYEVLGKATPAFSDCVRYFISRQDENSDRTEIVSIGMNVFGAQEFIVRDVPEDRIDTVMPLLEKILGDVSYSTLPDEGNSFRVGMIYQRRNYVQLTWKHCESGKKIYAEPRLHFSPDDKEGLLLTEVTDDILSEVTLRRHNRASYADETRAHNLYKYALEYFESHDCRLSAGMYLYAEDENGEENEYYIECDVQHGGKSGVVTNNYGAERYSVGDCIEVDAEKVFWFGIEKNDGDRYTADELYILMQEK